MLGSESCVVCGRPPPYIYSLGDPVWFSFFLTNGFAMCRGWADLVSLSPTGRSL